MNPETELYSRVARDLGAGDRWRPGSVAAFALINTDYFKFITSFLTINNDTMHPTFYGVGQQVRY